MVDIDAVRKMALSLRETTERVAPRGGHPQFVTNGKCFAGLPQSGAAVEVWSDGGWLTLPLASTTEARVRDALEQAWRARAQKRVVAGLDYEIGADELSEVFAELRMWPDLTETDPGWYEAGGRAFLHFHHSSTARHADVKEGKGWGDAIPFPLGRPPRAFTKAFLAEVRRRLDITLAALGR